MAADKSAVKSSLLIRPPGQPYGRSGIVVHPSYQSHGLGRSLLASISETLMMERFTEVTLGGLEENLAARKIHKDADWQVTGRGFRAASSCEGK